MEIGPQYKRDDDFKAAARKHQSRYRAEVLAVEFDTYGNRLTDVDGKALLNYYSKLNVQSELRERYPRYSKTRDADMLRSEHIPFNMFAPLKVNQELAVRVLLKAFNIECCRIKGLKFEWAPDGKENYLGDHTAFDVYFELFDDQDRKIGIGVEVKNTERGYRIGNTEARRIADPNSLYWTVSKKSGVFVDNLSKEVASDDLRQIWRNHLLGLAMCLRNDISDFISITLHPAGNMHFYSAINAYKEFLISEKRYQVRGCTYEDFIATIDGDQAILDWKSYLSDRYRV